MTIEAKIVADSISEEGKRITTFVLKYPRFIHSEVMTHRLLSRNASSSRAIPLKTQIKMIEEDVARPIEFRQNQKGMQAGDALPEKDQNVANYLWTRACKQAIEIAKDLDLCGVHKQYVNRILEPFAHITVVVTATEYANFFALRYHGMAQPEFKELAKQMWQLYSTNTPTLLKEGEWHLPFVPLSEIDAHLEARSKENKTSFEECWLPLIKRCVARCARVSYLNHDGTQTTQEQDEALHERLLGANPKHSSAAEHAARPSSVGTWSGNFNGWEQYRKMIPGENIEHFEGPLDGKE